MTVHFFAIKAYTVSQMKKSCSVRVDSMARPQGTLRSQVLAKALETFVVPVFTDHYGIISFRALWEVDKDKTHRAELNIWKKRHELEALVESVEFVVGFFATITAMPNQKKQKKRRLENDEDDTTDEEIQNGKGFTPGI